MIYSRHIQRAKVGDGWVKSKTLHSNNYVDGPFIREVLMEALEKELRAKVKVLHFKVSRTSTYLDLVPGNKFIRSFVAFAGRMSITGISEVIIQSLIRAYVAKKIKAVYGKFYKLEKHAVILQSFISKRGMAANRYTVNFKIKNEQRYIVPQVLEEESAAQLSFNDLVYEAKRALRNYLNVHDVLYDFIGTESDSFGRQHVIAYNCVGYKLGIVGESAYLWILRRYRIFKGIKIISWTYQETNTGNYIIEITELRRY